MKTKKILLVIILEILFIIKGFPQQEVDTAFTAKISDPLYTKLSPIIAIDNLHHNLHTLTTGFAPFAKLASQDGFKIINFENYSQLEGIDILVIANPLHNDNIGNWKKPIFPAFSEEEVQRIVEWVNSGGALLLIADHMPFAGAANILAQKFGFFYCDGFAKLQSKESKRDVFSVENGRLNLSQLSDSLKINEIYTFTGSAFTYPEKAHSLLNFKENDFCLLPEQAWDFNDSTPYSDLSNMSQGAIMNFGKGRIAVFGEAAMFTAQSIKQNDNTFKVGFNSSFASGNIPFIRQILKWLSEAKLNPVREEIFETMSQMEELFNKGKFQEVAGFYTEDGQMIGNSVHIKGKDEIKKYWSMFSGKLFWKLENENFVQLTENYVLQNGFSNISFTGPDGQEQNSRSYFSLIWEKQDDQWKIKLDHFSPRK